MENIDSAALSPVDSATVNRLLMKSKEAFLLAVELYNRPTIKYHVEGCAFFLCNAWELMLKACLIKRDGITSIYYPHQEGRTISLDDCLKRIYTNEKDPLRRNMEKTIDLRNTSTHFVVEEYEVIYSPILQACVENYDEQLRKLHNIEISDFIPENYLVLSTRRSVIDEDECRARYTQADLNKMLETMEGIYTASDELQNRRFACTYVTELRSTKKSDADLSFRLAKDGGQPAAVVKQLVMAKDKYPYRPTKVVDEINKRLVREHITLLRDGIDTSLSNKQHKSFNMYHFGLFKSCYSMNGDSRYSVNAALEGENPAYIYSQQAVDLIWEKLKENPRGILDRLKTEIEKAARERPQEQRNSKH